MISDRIEKASAMAAITAAEAMSLRHHLALSGRGKYRYVSAQDRAMFADIAKRVRVATS